MVTAHQSSFSKLSVSPINVTEITLVPSKLIMVKAFLKCMVRLKDTENWGNRIKNYMKESSGSCFLYTASYTKHSNRNHLIKQYIDGKSSSPYRSHWSDKVRGGRRAAHLGKMPSREGNQVRGGQRGS